MILNEDICSIATGISTSAIAIIRISGNSIVDKISPYIQFRSENKTFNNLKSRTLYNAYFVANGKTLDEIMLTLFRKPHSYTGEDMIELYCHGSLFVQAEILKTLQNAGFRLAQPGEFTLRAYLNGKIDLTQAEAINDIITSRDQLSHQLAIQQLKGGISLEIKEIRKQLLNLLTYVELELDFAEEDVEFASREQIRNILNELIKKIERLSYSYEFGNAIKKGILVAIVGETNVGKSTLMNALLKEDKSIVSSIPGTTRDIIEDYFTYEGITFRFADTAGIRNSNNEIEQIGIEKAIYKATLANIVLVLVDSTSSLSDIFKQMEFWNSKINSEKKKIFLIINKADKLTKEDLLEKITEIKQHYSNTIAISAKFSLNIDELLNKMVFYVRSLNVSGSEHIITSSRQWHALIKALDTAKTALLALDNKLPTDLFAQELRMVNACLAEVIGEVHSTEVLNEIFSRFCIGK